MLLRPVHAEDINACAHTAGLAFRNDRHTQLKSCMLRETYNHEAGMRDALRYWLRRPDEQVEVIAAVDENNDTIMGWIVWNSRGFDLKAASSPRAKSQEDIEIDTSAEDDSTQAQCSHSGPTLESMSARAKLELYTSADLEQWIEKLMPPTVRCMFISCIAVHPQYQGIGVGAALVQRGTDRADIENVFCWVHTSQSATAFFGGQGFDEIGRLELDLDAWNEEHVDPPEGPQARWGNYVFRYMKRDPDSKNTLNKTSS